MVRTVRAYGYHGTNAERAAVILRAGFQQSTNDYDWLGDGIYFWQDAPARAWEWARNVHGDQAAVLCARIRLDNCLDLLDIAWEAPLAVEYQIFVALMARLGKPLPKQSAGAHRLDRAVINRAAERYGQASVLIGAVRGAFQEGMPIFPSSALFNRTHVQIAVREPRLIEDLWIAESV